MAPDRCGAGAPAGPGQRRIGFVSAQPYEEIGRLAARCVLDGPPFLPEEDGAGREILVPTRLIVRASTQPPSPP